MRWAPRHYSGRRGVRAELGLDLIIPRSPQAGRLQLGAPLVFLPICFWDWTFGDSSVPSVPATLPSADLPGNCSPGVSLWPWEP